MFWVVIAGLPVILLYFYFMLLTNCSLTSIHRIDASFLSLLYNGRSHHPRSLSADYFPDICGVRIFGDTFCKLSCHCRCSFTCDLCISSHCLLFVFSNVYFVRQPLYSMLIVRILVWLNLLFCYVVI